MTGHRAASGAVSPLSLDVCGIQVAPGDDPVTLETVRIAAVHHTKLYWCMSDRETVVCLALRLICACTPSVRPYHIFVHLLRFNGAAH